MLEGALNLAGRGFSVFRLAKGTKVPAFKGWQAEATTDADQIRRWWAEADYNIGVRTGNGLLVLDIDKNGKPGPESLKSLALTQDDYQTFVVRTASGGYHMYFETAEPFGNSPGDLGPGLDVRGAGGYVVGPGSVLSNGSAGGAYTITRDTPLRPLPAQIRERIYVRRERDERATLPLVELDRDDSTERAVDYLLTVAPLAIEGQRGELTTFKVAAVLKDFGISQDATAGLMDDYWNDRCSPPWDLEGLTRKVANAYEYGCDPPGSGHPSIAFAGVHPIAAPTGAPPSRRSAILRFLGDVADRPPAWLVKGLLPKTGVALLSGQSRVGKTFLAIDLAGAVATAGQFFGHQVKEPSGVLFILGEGTGSMGMRMEALRLRKLEGLQHEQLPIAWVEADDPSQIASAMAEANAELQHRFGVRLGLVVIDTLPAVFNVTDENEAHQATGVMKQLQRFSREYRCLILGVTHYGKNAESGVRGSSAWTASSDVVLAATAKISETTGSVTDRRLALTKNRDADTGPISAFELEPVQLGLDEDMGSIVSMVVRPCAGKARGAKVSRHIPLLLACVQEVIASEPTDVGGRAMAARSRVRALFRQKVPGSKDTGNVSRAFSTALALAGLMVETMGDGEYLSPPSDDGETSAVCAVAS
ncbi:MAG: bifunctional DNA primase/polymerase [Caulobacterales bacterium]